MTANGSTDGLQTISRDGQVPACRMRDAMATQDFVRILIDNDNKASKKRALVNGLVDGNPPYERSALVKANRADAANVNWGVGRAFLDSGAGAFYDLVAEAPGFLSIKTSYGEDEDRIEEYSRTMSSEADRILSMDPVWDYNRQVSIWDMVLHGCGPFLFEDNYGVLPKAFHCGDLKVPKRTKSDTFYWDAGVILCDYYPPELYEFIKDEKMATARGWDVEYTKAVIQNAMNIVAQPGRAYDWEYYQQELKNNSYQYVDDTKICSLAQVFWKEFNGRVSHGIVERDQATGRLPTKDPRDKGQGKSACYLFQSVGRFANFQQVIHPMYFDHGNGGFHHSVTGLGVKMYSQFVYQNRLLCNLLDKAFSPKTLFKPMSTEGTERFQLAVHGDYACLPKGYDAIQNPITGMMTEGLTMNEEINQVMQSNLSSYRQAVPMQTSGNPPTKFQKQLEATQQSALANTTFNRYYEQLDLLYAEIARRLCDLNSTDKRAQEFQERCVKLGVKRECFGRIEKVEAVRVVGKGSTFMRKMAVDGVAAIVGSLPEDGRNNWLNDKIAAEAGQNAVARYNPAKKKNQLANDQQAEAFQWVASMKVGVPPVVTSTQNPVTYAGTFLTAAVHALESVRQGADKNEVIAFLDIAGPAVKAQLMRFSQDPTRKKAFEVMYEQWEQLARVTDNLKKAAQGEAKQMQQQKQKTDKAMSDAQIKNRKMIWDERRKDAKQRFELGRTAATTSQDMALKDASTAADIHLNRLKSLQTSGSSEGT